MKRTRTRYRASQSHQPRTRNRASQSRGATSDTWQRSSVSLGGTQESGGGCQAHGTRVQASVRATAKRPTGRRRMSKLLSPEEMGANTMTDAQGQNMPTIDCLLPWADIGIKTFRHCINGLAKSCVETCHGSEFLPVTMKPQSNKNILPVVMTLYPHQAPYILAL